MYITYKPNQTLPNQSQALALWADFKTSGLLADRILYLSLMNALNNNHPSHSHSSHGHGHGGEGSKGGGGARGGKTERETVFDLLDEAAEAGIPLDTQVGGCVYMCVGVFLSGFGVWGWVWVGVFGCLGPGPHKPTNHPKIHSTDPSNTKHTQQKHQQLANYALRLLAGARDVEGVEMLLERMRTGGVGRDVVSWTTAIKVRCGGC